MRKCLNSRIAALLGGARGSRGSRGESLVEVLVAITIGGLALLMLAVAIAVSARIGLSNRANMQDYYEANNAAVAGGALPAGTGSMSLSDGTESFSLTADGTALDVEYRKITESESSAVVLYVSGE